MTGKKNRVHGDYDLELAVLCWITNETGYQWTFREIAAICGVSPQAIRWIFINAKRRVWRLLHTDHGLIEDLNESRGMDGSNRYFLPGRGRCG